MNRIEMYQAQIEETLEVLRNSGIQGVGEAEIIMDEIKDAGIWQTEVTIITNDRFDLCWNTKYNKLKFTTVYSNQEITDEWLEELKSIKLASQLIGSFLKMASEKIAEQAK